MEFKLVEITPAQIALIQKTWGIPAANPTDSGEAIFYAFLEKYPTYKNDFPKFKDLQLNELKGNEKFRAHATKIFNVFTTAVNSLGTSGLEGQMQELAKLHNSRNVTNKQKFVEIRAVIVDTLTAVCSLDAEGVAAWNAFLDNFYFYFFKYL